MIWLYSRVNLLFQCRAIINKWHGGYPVINLLATCVHISGETCNVIVHSHTQNKN